MQYKIAAFELDLARECLLRDGTEVHLKPKTFQVAAFLLANRDRLVSKDEIMEACWKDTAVTDDVLSQAIAEFRRALGDNPREPVYLKTIPRRGFRFIGPVEEVQLQLTAHEEVTRVEIREEITTEEHPSAKRWIWIAAVAVLLLAGTGFWIWSYLNPGLPPPSGGRRQVAVFRFVNQTGQAEIDWMRDGLPDMLATTLSRSQSLEVLSRDQLSVWLGRIGDTGLKGAIELARRSQAQIAILGSFAQTGRSIRVEAQIYDGRSGKLLAADSLVADAPEKVLIQVDQLAARLAGRLLAQVPGPSLPEAMTRNLEAYREYSLGLEQAEGFHVDAAIGHFQRAIELDPDFDMAYARIGYVYTISAGLIEKGRPYLERAYQKSGRLTERDRRHVLAWYAIANQNYREAIGRYRELIVAYPREIESYHRLAVLLRGDSNHEESTEVAKQGLAIDGDARRLWNSLAATYSEMGRHAEAIDAAHRYLKLAPAEANAYDSLALAYEFAGDHERALEALSQALHLDPGFGTAMAHRQTILAGAGRYREALEIADHLPRDMHPGRFIHQAAWIYWRLGREGEARAAMEKLDPKLYQWSPVALLSPKIAEAMRRSALPGRGSRWALRYQFFYTAQEARMAKRPEEMFASLKELVRHRASWGMMETLEDALADGLLETGRVPEAIAEYRRALQLYPGMALARFHLGQALLKSGDRAGASDQFKRFLELWKNADAGLPQLAEARHGLIP